MKVLVDEHTERIDVDEALQQVSQQRREQALRFKHDEGRRLSLAAYRLLCQALAEEYGMTTLPVFAYGPNGKPSIEGRPDICFNLSHSRHVAACVVDSQPVGIDVEVVRPLRESLARYVLSDQEYASVMASDDPARAFTRLWTKKEALMKLRGTGISNHMQHVLDNLPPNVCLDTVDGPDYVVTTAAFGLNKRPSA